MLTFQGQGQRMGGGKGSIDHYVTPVKADRVILEMGGKCEFAEVSRIELLCTSNVSPETCIYIYVHILFQSFSLKI